MKKNFLFFVGLFFSFCMVNCAEDCSDSLVIAAQRIELFQPMLEGKRVGLLVNHSSICDESHLLDTLLSLNINVKKVFSPEHGFRGSADAGAWVKDGIDDKTGLPIISLYGNNRKPSASQLEGIDVVVFDIQDVGVRFYTYVSSMHLMMEACSDAGIEFIVLDRPNPNGDYVDGPVLDISFQSFVGMHPIPVVHGLTVGELAKMINEEGWLKTSAKCSLTVVPMLGYTHQMSYSLPVIPSPNLPTDISVRLYPSLCLFEATNLSVGRGTYFPFQVVGGTQVSYGDFSFTPQSIVGMSSNPKFKGTTCYGIDLRNEPLSHRFTLKYLLYFYQKSNDKKGFFPSDSWFNQLAGNKLLLQQIRNGLSEEEIKASWHEDLQLYHKMRKQYLIYP